MVCFLTSRSGCQAMMCTRFSHADGLLRIPTCRARQRGERSRLHATWPRADATRAWRRAHSSWASEAQTTARAFVENVGLPHLSPQVTDAMRIRKRLLDDAEACRFLGGASKRAPANRRFTQGRTPARARRKHDADERSQRGRTTSHCTSTISCSRAPVWRSAQACPCTVTLRPSSLKLQPSGWSRFSCAPSSVTST